LLVTRCFLPHHRQGLGIENVCKELCGYLWLAKTERGVQLLLKGQRPRAQLMADALQGDQVILSHTHTHHKHHTSHTRTHTCTHTHT
jgi:hypothetical protein